MNELLIKVKEKREFSGLPDSVILRVLNFKQIKNKVDSEKIKMARSFLRKYFGVFLTNKVMKGTDESVLNNHISSKKRDYELFYSKIGSVVGNGFSSIIDFGCGMNGFSYSVMKKEFGKIKYLGIEATKQLCELQNNFFKKNNFNGEVVWGDLLEQEFVKNTIKMTDTPRLIFLFQTIDAMENIEPNSSKSFLLNIEKMMGDKDVLVISNSTKSISGKNNFKIQRRWLENFIDDNFKLVNMFELFDEMFLVAKHI